MKIVEIDNVSELPKIQLWNSVAPTIEEAIGEVVKRTGKEVTIVYKFKGRREFFIPFPGYKQQLQEMGL